jgi:hypothetical protein
MKSAPSQCTSPGRASEERGLVRVGSKAAVGEEGDQHEGDHHGAADGAERIAPAEEDERAEPSVDVGAGPGELGIVVDDGH